MSDNLNVPGSNAVDVWALGTSSIIDAEHTLELQRELMACNASDTLDHSTIMQAMEMFIASQGFLEDEYLNGCITDKQVEPKHEEINLDCNLEDPLNPDMPTKVDVTLTDLPQLVDTNNLPSVVTGPMMVVSTLVEPATRCAGVSPSSGDYSIEPSDILKRPLGGQSSSANSVAIVVTQNHTPHVSQSKVPSAIGKSSVCDICGLNFTNRKQLNIHMRCIHSKYSCSRCSKTYRSYLGIMLHKSEHLTKCVSCKGFFNTKELIDHKITCHLPKFECSICKSSLKDHNELTEHYNTVHSKFKCHVCDTLTGSMQSFKRHILLHQTWRNNCLICMCVCKSGQLRRHYYFEHAKYKCPTCHFRLDTPDALRRHVDTHANEHWCETCKACFGTNEELEHHITRKHQCKMCDLKFLERNDLVTHQKTHIVASQMALLPPISNKTTPETNSHSSMPNVYIIGQAVSADESAVPETPNIHNSSCTYMQGEVCVSASSHKPPTTEEVRSYVTDTQADGFVIGNSHIPPTTEVVRSYVTDMQADGFVIGNSHIPQTIDEVRSSVPDTQADGFVFGNSCRPPTDEVRSSDTDMPEGLTPTVVPYVEDDTDLLEERARAVMPPVEEDEIIEVTFIQHPIRINLQVEPLDKSQVGGYRCDFCDLQLPTLDEIRIHKSTHPNYSYKCKTCSSWYITKAGLDSHCKREHGMRDSGFTKSQMNGQNGVEGDELQLTAEAESSTYCAVVDQPEDVEVQTVSPLSEQFQCRDLDSLRGSLDEVRSVEKPKDVEVQTVSPLSEQLQCRDLDSLRGSLDEVRSVEKPKDVEVQTVSPLSEQLQCRDIDSLRGSLDEVRSVEKKSTVKYRCEFCRLLLHSLKDYAAHQKIHQAKLQCVLCYALLDTLEDLMAHEQTHTVEYRCSICKLQLESMEQLWVHEKVHMVKFQCSFCGLVFDKLEDKMNHERMHTHKYQCNVCSSYFNTLEDCSVHEKTHKSSYECGFCNMLLDTQTDLTIHENAHRE